MPPPLETWPASQLDYRSQVSMKDTKRKGFDGDLKACKLLELLQYECGITEGPVTKESRIICWPVERFFRR
jgi:hypothetical protein